MVLQFIDSIGLSAKFAGLDEAWLATLLPQLAQ